MIPYRCLKQFETVVFFNDYHIFVIRCYVFTWPDGFVLQMGVNDDVAKAISHGKFLE